MPAGFSLREETYRATGVDLTAIDGVNVLTIQTLLSEAAWVSGETAQNFTAGQVPVLLVLFDTTAPGKDSGANWFIGVLDPPV